jgi:hypothetical protein
MVVGGAPDPRHKQTDAQCQVLDSELGLQHWLPLAQATPQAPQSLTLSGLQVPPQQSGSEQTLPQALQLAGSLFKSTQPEPAQQVRAPEQGVLLPLQTHWLSTHALPLPQFWQPDATHCPVEHDCPEGQGAAVHEPQCSGPLATSKQPPAPLVADGQQT